MTSAAASPAATARSGTTTTSLHWIDGGPTDTDNLLGLCRRHHRLVHEGGWRIEGDADSVVAFVAPGGRRLRSVPPPLDPQVWKRALRARRAAQRRSSEQPPRQWWTPPPP